MPKKFSKSAHLSHFDAREARVRVILLGASNLSLTFPIVIDMARAMFDKPLEFFVAMGFGRSYGQESKFFRKKFPGILQSDLWAALDRAPSLSTVAIVADVGNDLAYEAPVDRIVEWIEQTIDRLAKRGAHEVLNNVPIDSLRGVGHARYGLLRSILFPRCRVPHGEMLRRAEELSQALHQLAEARQIPIFSGEKSWYGFDPIHPRRTSAGEIWQRMLSAVAPATAAPTTSSPARDDARRLRRLQSRAWSELGREPRGEIISDRLDDGTTIALF